MLAGPVWPCPVLRPRCWPRSPTLPADEVFLDLEDSVAPLAKEEARHHVIDALKNNDWGDKTVVVRINSIDTQWAADDLKTVVEGAGQFLDCIMIPKVQYAHEVMFVDHMLRMIETNTGLDKRIGLEIQIETATGLKNIYEIAHASDRAETLIFGPADMSASLGLPTVTAGLPMPGLSGRSLALGSRDHPRRGARCEPSGHRRSLPLDQGPRRLPRDVAARSGPRATTASGRCTRARSTC